MRRRLAARAEVARRAHEAVAEVILPDAIDHDARGEGVVLAGDRFRELEASAAACEWLAVGARDDRGELPRDFLARAGGIAANENFRLHGRLAIDDRLCARRTARMRRRQPIHLLLKRALVDAVGRVEDVVSFRERSEEHTSELQSLAYLVCRLLLEKKKKRYIDKCEHMII